MNVEIWADLICPFCGLGSHRLDQALAAFEHRDDVTVEHRSFMLDPNFPHGEIRTARAMLRAKYGMTDAQIDANTGAIEATARAEGLDPYIVTDNRVGNTALAHELLALAADGGLEGEAWRLLYRHYFGEAGDIFTIDALIDLGVRLGLDAAGTREALEDRRHADRVLGDIDEARRLGATGVPFIVIDRRYAIAGAQPLETFTATLQSAWDDSHPS